MAGTNKTRKPPEGFRQAPGIWYIKLDGEYIGYTIAQVRAQWQWFLAWTMDGQAVINPGTSLDDNAYSRISAAQMALAVVSGKLGDEERALYVATLRGTPVCRKQ